MPMAMVEKYVVIEHLSMIGALMVVAVLRRRETAAAESKSSHNVLAESGGLSAT
jgi:hypothetical protein